MRRRQLIVALVVAALVLSSGGAVVIAIISSLGSSTPTTTSLPTRPTVAEAPPVDLALPDPGATASAETPCPPADGTGGRTTSFVGPPPVCVATTPDGAIDTAAEYRAIISTSAGELTYLLTTAATPQTVNAFVVLARYGYFDGSPFDRIVPLAWAETGGRFTDEPDLPRAAGFTVPRESSAQGMVATPGMLGMATTPGGDSEPGRLVLALGEGAGNLPVPTTFFAVLLDGTDTLAALQRSGTLTGAPSRLVTIERITVEQL
jgi:cyclophilin family peptidyl-prolyl cis-trans isomerase